MKTKEKLIADLRGGCCAIYPKSKSDETNGCHAYDKRNIFYSSRDAVFNGSYWDMNKDVQEYAEELVNRFNLHDELVEALKEANYILSKYVKTYKHTMKKANDLVEDALKKATS